MNRVNELIIESGLSQKQVAIEVGVSRPTVSDWANNKKDPRGENLQKLAKLFNVDWRRILITAAPPVQQNPEPRPASSLTDEDLAKIASLVTTGADAPRTVEARIVSFGMDKLPSEDRETILAMIRAMFAKRPEGRYFEKGNKSDET